MSATKRACGGMDGLFAIPLTALALSAVPSPVAAQTAPAKHENVQAAIPLADALRRFAKDSGYDVVFPEELVRGKRAAPVGDTHDAYETLTRLLAGSGLVPRFTRPDAFVLEPATPHASADLSLEKINVLSQPLGERSVEYRWYGEKLLETSLRTLRRSRELGFTTYDFTLYVWLSDDGQIVDLEGYGDAENQEALSIAKKMLLGLVVGITPPVNMPQPVGLQIIAQ